MIHQVLLILLLVKKSIKLSPSNRPQHVPFVLMLLLVSNLSAHLKLDVSGSKAAASGLEQVTLTSQTPTRVSNASSSLSKHIRRTARIQNVLIALSTWKKMIAMSLVCAHGPPTKLATG